MELTVDQELLELKTNGPQTFDDYISLKSAKVRFNAQLLFMIFLYPQHEYSARKSFSRNFRGILISCIIIPLQKNYVINIIRI